MSFKIDFAESVYEDISAALDYYVTISPELSLRFEEELLISFDKIKSYPFNYFNLQYGYRRITLRSFPYMIVYKIIKDNLLIIAVFHQYKNPEKLKNR